jgi:hypothetical protein
MSAKNVRARLRIVKKLLQREILFLFSYVFAQSVIDAFEISLQ